MYYMIELKSPRELALMRAAGQIVAGTFALLTGAVQPGVTLQELDRQAEQYIRQQGANPLYKGYRGSQGTNVPFPGVICTSVNDEICHGLPNRRVLREGDIVKIDVGLRYKGYCGDACVTFPVGAVTPSVERFLAITRKCLQVGIETAQPSNYLHDIGAAIERYAEAQGVAVVRDLAGHGIGRQLHEPPTWFHIRQPSRGPKLRPGMVFTIEPMVNMGTHKRRTLADGWTEVTADGSLSAQFEHTIAITDNGPEILTTL